MSSPLKLFRDKLNSFEARFPKLYGLIDLLVNVCVIIMLVLVIRTYLISPFQVYGPSMCNTLNYINGECKHQFGEYLIVNRAVYYPFGGYRYREPIRGDVVVFKPAQNKDEYYIKRVVALPGEQVKIQNGYVYIKNAEHQTWWQLPESYLNETNLGHTFPLIASQATEYEVPAGKYFVLGDNRQESTDSRQCFYTRSTQKCATENDHYLTLERIEGKAAVVLWPFSKIRFLSNPSYEQETPKK